MKVKKGLSSLKSKLLIITPPCKKLFHLFNLRRRLTKPFYSIKSRSIRRSAKKYKRSKEMIRSLSDVVVDEDHDRTRLLLLTSSPVSKSKSPTYLENDDYDDDDVEDACRSFENYLMEMIVEDGKVEDLMDVEDLLCLWKQLKSPVFLHLVSTFYGELCFDLFSAQ